MATSTIPIIGVNTIQLAGGIDLDDLKQTGLYGGYNCVNAPSGEANPIYTLLTIRYSASYITQLLICTHSTGATMYVRSYHVSSWTSWKKVSLT